MHIHIHICMYVRVIPISINEIKNSKSYFILDISHEVTMSG